MLWLTLRRARAADAGTRIEAVRALARSHHRNAIAQIDASLCDRDQQVRAAAVAAVSEQRGRDSVPALARALDDAAAEIRAAAASLLAEHGARDAISALVPRLADSAAQVRVAVEQALDRLDASWPASPQARTVVPKLVTARLGSPDRLGVMRVLGRIGGSEAVASLLHASRDADREVAAAAGEALVTVGEPAAAVVAVDLTDASASVRANAGGILVRIGWQPADPRIAAALAVATGAFDRAATLGEAAVESLLTAFTEPDERRAAEAGVALVRIGAPAVVPLIGLLGGSDPTHAARARDAIGAVGTPAVEALLEALNGPNRQIRAALAQALAAIADARAVPGLVSRLTDETEEVAKAIVQALDALEPAWTTRSDARQMLPSLLGQLVHARSSRSNGAAVVLARLVNASDKATLTRAFVEASSDSRGSLLWLLHQAGLIDASDVLMLIGLLLAAPANDRGNLAWLVAHIDPAWLRPPLDAETVGALVAGLPFMRERLAWSAFERLGSRAADALATIQQDSPASGVAHALLASYGDVRGLVPLAERAAIELTADAAPPNRKERKRSTRAEPPPIPGPSPTLSRALDAAARELIASGQAGPGGLDTRLTGGLSPAALRIVRAAVADALRADGADAQVVGRLAVELATEGGLDNGYVREVLSRLLPYAGPGPAEEAAARLIAARGLEGPAQRRNLQSLFTLANLNPALFELAERALSHAVRSLDSRHENYEPSMDEGDRALTGLCAIRGPVSEALLRLVARRADFEVELPTCNLPPTRYTIDFSGRRARAADELRKRGAPLE